jgi:AraC-like DNA-binding protein
MRTELGISIEIIRPILRALKAMGYEPADPGWSDTDHVVPGSAADQLLERAADALGRPAIGLELARHPPLGGLGALDYALLTSASVGDGLRRVSTFYRTATERVGLELARGPEYAELTLYRRPGIPHSRHWIELSLAIIVERIRQTTGQPIAIAEVAFQHPKPADATPYEAFFASRVRFGQELDHVRMAATVLDLPLQTAATTLATTLERAMTEIAPPQLEDGDPFIARVRRAVIEALDERRVDIAAVTERLHVTPRSLQRALKERNTSHRKLLDEIRCARAHQLLQDRGRSVVDVAYALGFSEPSAFFRAFRRWTGGTPAMMRRRD